MINDEEVRKELLAITWTIPALSGGSGYSHRIFQTLKQLSKLYNINLVCFEDDHGDEGRMEVEEFCHRVITVPLTMNRRRLNCFRYILSTVPLKIGEYYSRKMGEVIKEILDQDIDLLYVSDIRMAPYVVDVKSVPKILDAIDCWLTHYESRIRKGRVSLRTLLDISEYIKMRDYEPYTVSKFDLVTLRSTIEMEELNTTCPYNDFMVLPEGFDPEYYQPSPIPREPNSILFTGNLAYPPIQEGLLLFKKRILPLIKEEVPGAHLYIVGNNPPRSWVNKMIDRDIRIISDETNSRIYLNRCQLYICPLFTGSGLEHGLMEAIAMKVPLVSTSQGCEGVKIVNGVNGFIANHPESFCESVVWVLKNSDDANQLAENARSGIVKKYTWQTIVSDLNDQINLLLMRGGMNRKVMELRRKVA